MNKVFGNQNFDPDQFNRAINLAENFLYTDENLDFEHQIDRSFLPEIIRLCKENNIKLILVRTKTLRFSREVPEPPALNEYIDDLTPMHSAMMSRSLIFHTATACPQAYSRISIT